MAILKSLKCSYSLGSDWFFSETTTLGKNEGAFEGNLFLQGSQHFLGFDGTRRCTNFIHDLFICKGQIKLGLSTSSLIPDISS